MWRCAQVIIGRTSNKNNPKPKTRPKSTGPRDPNNQCGQSFVCTKVRRVKHERVSCQLGVPEFLTKCIALYYDFGCSPLKAIQWWPSCAGKGKMPVSVGSTSALFKDSWSWCERLQHEVYDDHYKSSVAMLCWPWKTALCGATTTNDCASKGSCGPTWVQR